MLPNLDTIMLIKHGFLLRPVGAPDRGGLHPGRFKYHYDEVPYDPGTKTKVARFLRGLRGRHV